MKIAEVIVYFHLVLGVQCVETIVEEAAFQVYLLRVSRLTNDDYLAGGSVIALQWIITASQLFATSTYSIENLVVAGGTTTVKKLGHSDKQIRTIENYYFPDLYYKNDELYSPNFALVKLSKAFDSTNVQRIPVCWDMSPSSSGEQVDLYRWTEKTRMIPFFIFYSLVQTKMDLHYSVRIVGYKLYSGDAYLLAETDKNYLGAGVFYEGKLLATVNQGIVDQNKLPIEPIITERQFLQEFIPDIIDSEDVSRPSRINTEQKVRDTSFQVLMHYPSTYNTKLAPICMGTIVDLQWVLTLASPLLRNDRDIKKFVAVAGLRNTAQPESNEQRKQCHQKYISQNFTLDENRSPLYDFALVQLKEPFEKKRFVNSITICWDMTALLNGIDVLVYSWALRAISAKKYHELIKSTVKIGTVRPGELGHGKFFQLAHPLDDNLKGGNIIVYEHGLVGITGWNEEGSKFNEVIIEMRKHCEFITELIPALGMTVDDDSVPKKKFCI